jgi:parallel beta-helix repeat protein
MPLGASSVPWSPPLTRDTPHYPGQFGVPGTDNARGARLDTNGKIIWVDPNAVGVSDQRDGTNPENPLSTVAAALTKVRPYCNDVIAVAPSAGWIHADTALGRATPVAEEVVVTVPGVRIVGLFSSGSLGVPWMPLTTNGVCITVYAMDVLIEGFCFWNSLVVTPVAIKAVWGGPNNYHGDNLTVRNCFFGGGMVAGIQLDYSYYAQIYQNYFDSILAAIVNLNTIGDPDYAHIYDNTFSRCGAAIKLLDSDECTIFNNRINGDGTGAANFIDLTGGGNNFVADNYLGCTLAQYTGPGGTCDDATSGEWVNNHCIDGDTVSVP